MISVGMDYRRGLHLHTHRRTILPPGCRPFSVAALKSTMLLPLTSYP